MDPIITAPSYYQWADKLVGLGLVFWHIVSMDGLEIATELSSTMECPACDSEAVNVQRMSCVGQTSCILSEAQQMPVLMSRRRVQSSITVTGAPMIDVLGRRYYILNDIM